MPIADVGKVGSFGMGSNQALCQILQELIDTFGVRNTSSSTSPSVIQASSMEFGGSRNDRFSDTSNHVSPTSYYAIVNVGSAVINTLTAATGYTETGYDGATLGDGEIIYGRFSSIQLTSGAVQAYSL